jgi:hypothetical protein
MKIRSAILELFQAYGQTDAVLIDTLQGRERTESDFLPCILSRHMPIDILNYINSLKLKIV